MWLLCISTSTSGMHGYVKGVYRSSSAFSRSHFSFRFSPSSIRYIEAKMLKVRISGAWYFSTYQCEKVVSSFACLTNVDRLLEQQKVP